jgi:2,5-diketo-D-gluconate reductase A
MLMKTLRRGAEIPAIGFGTWPLNDREAERMVASAIESGYRLIDTAEGYGNEVGVGRGLRASGVHREEIVITSKFNRQWHSVRGVTTTFEESSGRLGVDYIDLLLIHWPVPEQDRYVDAFEGLLGLFEEGKIRAIGTSNFKPAHLDRLLSSTGQLPDINQIQCNPEFARTSVREYHAKNKIITSSWQPLGGEGGGLLSKELVGHIADKHNKSPAQVLLRWQVQLGLVPIVKSSNPGRAKENLDVFSFSLSRAEISALSVLDRGESAAVDSDEPGF